MGKIKTSIFLSSLFFSFFSQSSSLELKSNKITVLSWNIFMRPFLAGHDGQLERYERIPEYIKRLAHKKIDVIVFQENFLTGRVQTKFLRDLEKAGFPYRTTVINSKNDLSVQPAKLINGGVFIASRWPITKEGQTVYKNCALADCLAAKGVSYAAVKKPGMRTFHVFGTHFQAYNTKKTNSIRDKQAKQMHSFIDEQKIPAEETVIMAGDLNTTFHEQENLTERIMDSLGAEKPRGLYYFSIDPNRNNFVGKSGEAKFLGCYKEYRKTQTCPCCYKALIDYVFYSKNHKKPLKQNTITLWGKTMEPFRICAEAPLQPWHIAYNSMFCSLTWSTRDLSDHLPVLSTLEF